MTRKAIPRSEGAAPLPFPLEQLAARHGLTLTQEQAGRLERLDHLATEWNRVVDLSGFRSAEERVNRYFLEPVDAARWLPRGGGEALDVGTGGGSPALPLAVLDTSKRWTLLEPNARRAVFLDEAARSLSLDGVRVERARLEEFAPSSRFVAITCRGVALDRGSVERMAGWLEPGGRLLLFSGEARSEILRGWRGRLRERARVALAPSFTAWLVVLESPSEN